MLFIQVYRNLILFFCCIADISDIKPTNILLELENTNNTISQYLSEVPVRSDSRNGAAVPLREVISTPLVSETKNLHIRLIDFGVGK